MISTTRFCQGISDLSDSYSAFILDQYGVLHNGEKVFDGVIECLTELKNRKKAVIMLANSSKRAAENRARLARIGIPENLYDHLITSSEMVWQGLNDKTGLFKGLGKKVYLITRDNDQSLIDGLDLERVMDPKDADFMLIAGCDAPQKSLEDYDVILKAAAHKRLKAVCSNPEMRGLVNGLPVMGTGMIGRRYQDFGGVVTYIGKPYEPIFGECQKLLRARDIFPGQALVIGDAMDQDIMGGLNAEMDTCLIAATGLHAGSFKGMANLADLEKSLNNLVIAHNNIRPNFIVPKFMWGKALPDRKHRKRPPRVA
jgi:HAD superfamily hydrolase (TIGR01459 family)